MPAFIEKLNWLIKNRVNREKILKFDSFTVIWKDIDHTKKKMVQNFHCKPHPVVRWRKSADIGPKWHSVSLLLSTPVKWVNALWQQNGEMSLETMQSSHTSEWRHSTKTNPILFKLVFNKFINGIYQLVVLFILIKKFHLP